MSSNCVTKYVFIELHFHGKIYLQNRADFFKNSELKKGTCKCNDKILPLEYSILQEVR